MFLLREPLEMDELAELSVLIVGAYPKDSNHYHFWVVENELTSKQYLNSKFTEECSTRADSRDKQLAHKAVKRVYLADRVYGRV